MMPTDTKRVVGPPESVSVSKLSVADSLPVPFTGRRNGRDHMKSRPIFLQPNVITQARGSAYIEMANTKIICAVNGNHVDQNSSQNSRLKVNGRSQKTRSTRYGPRESSRREDFSMEGQLTCDVKFAPFSCPATRRQHMSDQEERELSDVVMQAFQAAVRLDQYPKGVIDISIKVLEHDGNVLGGCLTGVSAALASAGIEMCDLVIGASVRQYGDITLVDPDYTEEKRLQVLDTYNDGVVTLGLMTSLNQVCALTMHGQVSASRAQNCVSACKEACYQIYPVVEKALTDSLVT